MSEPFTLQMSLVHAGMAFSICGKFRSNMFMHSKKVKKNASIRGLAISLTFDLLTSKFNQDYLCPKLHQIYNLLKFSQAIYKISR